MSNTANNHLLYSLVDATTPVNQAPTASFTASPNGLTVTFTDESTDPDPGDGVITWSWAFGDGDTSTSTLQHPTHTYAASGTYTVTLTVTDNDETTNSASQSVTVSNSSAVITLTATLLKQGALYYGELRWSGATTTNVDVWRNGVLTATTANDGLYADKIGKKVTGTYNYKVCEAGTTTCSNEVTIPF